MMPNIDPRQLKQMMERMGIKSTDIEAERVIIVGKERDIVIENPQVTSIMAQGNQSFQVVGDVKEVDKISAEIGEDDVHMVMERSGVRDETRARSALQETNGDIAAAILKLKQEG